MKIKCSKKIFDRYIKAGYSDLQYTEIVGNLIEVECTTKEQEVLLTTLTHRMDCRTCPFRHTECKFPYRRTCSEVLQEFIEWEVTDHE